MSHRLIPIAAAIVLGACAHKSPAVATAQPKPTPPIHILERWSPAPAGTRLLIQFNDEKPFIEIADGNYGPPILYHGRELNPDQIKSIRLLKGSQAHDRFPDKNVDAAILIELK